MRAVQAVRAHGKVEVQWGNCSTSVVEAASLTENKQGWDRLSKKQKRECRARPRNKPTTSVCVLVLISTLN